MSSDLNFADTARLAHRVLRLRENGVDSESKLARLAKPAAAANADPSRPRFAANGMIADSAVSVGDGGSALAVIAFAVQHVLDEELDGPTDREAVQRLMGRSLTDIHREWDEAVTANLEATLDDAALRAWRESVTRDTKAFAERCAQMQERGDWPVHPAFGHSRHLEGAANALYDEGRAGFLAGEIDWDTATIKAILVDSADYAVNLATHKFLSSVPAAAREETTAAFATKTVAAGVADADDTSWPSAAGDPCEAVIYVQSSAVGGGADVADTGQRLIGYADTYTGLPVTLNGGTVNLVHDNGANRIFKL
jgi:hypothetical protein